MNKTALITGASKRIGKSLTEHLASKGWNILIHYFTSEKNALDLASMLREKYPNGRYIPVKANLSNVNEVEILIPDILKEYGRFELLINNASVFDPGYISLTGSDLLNAQLDVNLIAPFILMRDFKIHCRKGNIINFVDTRITKNKSDFAAYSLSKKALWELTKMAALEFAPEIRVNAIAPGVTLAPSDKDEDYLFDLAIQIPMKKPGGTKPIIKSLDYLLGNDHITGQLLFADGGENLGVNK